MNTATKPITINPDPGFAKVLEQAEQDPVIVETNGKLYRVVSLGEEKQFEQFLMSDAFQAEADEAERLLRKDPDKLIKWEDIAPKNV
jgi:hypothetical protein